MTRLHPSRLRRAPGVWRWLALIAVAGGLLIGWSAVDGRLAGTSPSPAPEAAASAPTRPSDAFALTVDHVFDGDTIAARVREPNDAVPTADPVRIRLIGIDAPEGTPAPECWADEARDHLRALRPEGSTVWAAADTEWRDRYGRVLLHLWTDGGRFVNHELIAEGDAAAMFVPPNGEHRALFTAAESSARSASLGRWGACE